MILYSHCLLFLVLVLHKTAAFTIMTDNITVLDSVTPINENLTAYYKRSFAFHTVKERMPIILTQTIDRLVRDKENIVREYGNESSEELKTVIGELSKLKYEIQTNKPLKNISDSSEDAKTWNDYLLVQTKHWGEVPTYYRSIWLHSECFMYRRMREMFEQTNILKNFDPFRKQKIDSYTNSLAAIEGLSAHLLSVLNDISPENVKTEFINFLKLNLWGNRCDLSISNGADCAQVLDPLLVVNQYEPYILSDHSENIWEAISKTENTSTIVDIVNDNAGYELFTDLCLADYIISNNLATKIRFHVKSIPWFISDVMYFDFHWMIDTLKNSTNPTLHAIGTRWKAYVESNKWVLVNNKFWTFPFDFTYMKNTAPELYEQLSEAKLIIFKGDLNYRKLFGEKYWDSTKPVDDALQGFHPSKLCTLRTIKCDCYCGLPAGIVDKLEKEDNFWAGTGKYGLIQFSGLVS